MLEDAAQPANKGADGDDHAAGEDASRPGSFLKDWGITSDEMVREVFREWDVQRSGRIPRDDLAKLVQALLPSISTVRLVDIFERCDVDGDGFLSYEEFVSFVFSLGESSTQSHAPERLLAKGDSGQRTSKAASDEVTPVPSSSQIEEAALPLLSICKEPSCPGTLLVAAGVPLGERITMLGGMLAHPCVGCYPYRDGPAPTIVAAQLSAGTGGGIPLAVRRSLAKLGADYTFDFFFIVSDVSKHGLARAAAFNIVHHPWCFPKVAPGQTIGTGAGWMVGLHVPSGGGLEPEAGPRMGSRGARRRDCDPTGAALDILEPTSVFVHPGFGGTLCCSPNNVRVGLKRPSAVPVATVWATCARGNGTAKAPRACVSLHWLVASAPIATALTSAATEAATLQDFFGIASSVLEPHSAPLTAVATAAGLDEG